MLDVVPVSMFILKIYVIDELLACWNSGDFCLSFTAGYITYNYNLNRKGYDTFSESRRIKFLFVSKTIEAVLFSCSKEDAKIWVR
jgi:hypothetical protein